ncbi:hypothetical protein HIM_06878 [Hirsutella minnesotensis 3608]|uniref:L-asparaginase n=1 Tax=Hirsutella minnesotensis 3608 TaxID=1043627 RepID=A0A0F7ZNH5_9HYPO|nr:hypothetical protein HIM_06878 [Hirsutella minnesotensis 3608]
MEYEKQQQPLSAWSTGIKPRIIIHGGAGNIQRRNFPPEKYEQYRAALLATVRSTQDFIESAVPEKCGELGKRHHSALDIACHAIVRLEDNPLFNAGRGAVFTRDGINQLEASVVVSRGRAKHCAGVSGLRHVRNPILLAKTMLERGDKDLRPEAGRGGAASSASPGLGDEELDGAGRQGPAARGRAWWRGLGHTLVWGRAAEQLARDYGLQMVDPSYFFTQHRWDEHIRGLEREKQGLGSATWSADEYVAQGTVGAVALDQDGIVCAATSTGGMTNKLTGRIGDTPVPGAGFWAEEWTESGHPTSRGGWEKLTDAAARSGPGVSISGPLRGLLADCLPTPFTYAPSPSSSPHMPLTFDASSSPRTAVSRSLGVSGTGGPHGELQRSAGDRWGLAGEGEGGMVGVECVVERDAASGQVVRVRSDVVMDFNCGGMNRAWIDEHGQAIMSVWTNGGPDADRP